MFKGYLISTISSIWVAALGIIVVPFYLDRLGVDNYGLIGFYTLLQTVLLIFDFGMSHTINREIAQKLNAGHGSEVRTLFYSYLVLTWAIAVLIGFFIVIFASPIAAYWLKSRVISAETVNAAMQLIGIALVFKWPVTLYQGVLSGLHRQSTWGKYNILAMTFVYSGSLIVLLFFSVSIEHFFVWHCVANFINIANLHRITWKALQLKYGGNLQSCRVTHLNCYHSASASWH